MVAQNAEVLPFGLNMILNEITRLNVKKKWGSVKVVTLFSETPFDELAKKLEALEMSFDYREITRENGFTLLGCTATLRAKDVLISGSFYAMQKAPFLYFITGEKNLFFRRVMLKIALKLFPKAIRTYVTSEDLLKLLKNFSKSKEINLRYTEFVSKRMFGKAFTEMRHDKRLDARKYENFFDAFRKADEQGGRIHRIKLFGNGYSFSISRNGVLKIYSGDFTDFYNFFITQIGEIAVTRWKIFEKRSRGELPQKEVKPILLRFDSDVFEETSERKQFIEILGEYTNCEYSVIHEGNPHVYVIILDKLDNSSFTVRTYDANSLLLIPQIRTTSAALVRFSKHLLDKFQEGELADFAK